MSIIIRLQNLPWSANAENIRQFFGSLVIPDGGVHIVGGEHGDAFIAFGSDEDARQAMAKDGGDIKGVKVRLLLSSRVEMQKVIDAARQQALTSQNLLHTLSAVNPHLQYDPTAPPAMPVGLPPNLLSALPGLVNLPALNALPMMPNVPAMPAGLTPMPFPMPVASAATAARAVETKAAPTLSLPSPFPLPRAAVVPATSSEQAADKKREGAQPASSRGQKASESRSRSRSGSRSRDRRGYRDKYRGSDSRSGDRKYRRERSKSRDREKRSERSRSRERHRRRSRSRERRNEDRGRDHRNRSKERRRDSERGGKKDEATASAAKAAYKAAYGNAAAGAPSAAGKAALDEIRATTAGGVSRPDSAAAAKSSPAADAAKASVETRATWPSAAAQQSAAAWTAAIPTPSERKGALDSPKTADANVGGGGSSAPTSTAAALPQMPSLPPMPMPGMSSMPSAMPYSMAAAYSMAYAAAAPNSVYAMNRFPLTAQQAAALYSGYPMGMMGQPNFGQFQSAASTTAAASASAPAQQLEKADATANGRPDEGDNDGDDDDDADVLEEEEVDCFGRVRKKSRRPSYSPEKKSGAAAFENGDRRDSYRSRMDGSSLGGSGGGKPYHRDSYHSDENRYYRSAAEDGGSRKTAYRRNLDRHDGGGGGDERRAHTERRGENAVGDRRNYGRFDGGGDDERKATPAYDGRHSRTEERGGAAATAEYRRNPDRYGGGGGGDDRPERPFRASRFDEPRRNATSPYSNVVEQREAEVAEEMAAVHAQQQQQREYGAGGSPLPVVFQTCVEVRNVAAEVTERDVKRFFEPLPLFDSSIKFQYKTHGDGSHSTSVLVKFVNEAQRAQALQLTGKFLRGQRTLILECEQRAFEQAEDMAVRLQQPYLKLVFVPKRATPDDIANAFTLPPDEVVIVQQNGRESLEAYLKFGDTQPAVDALKHKDKVTICNSRVKLAAIPEAEFDAAKMHAKASAASAPPGSLPASGNYVVEGGNGAGDGDGAAGDCQPPPPRDEAAAPRANGGHGDDATPPPFTCVHFASLPADVTDKDIVRFLQDVDVTPHRIHIMYSADGQPSGEAFCEFADEAAVQRALQKDRCLMNDYIVEMTAISAAQLEAAVNEVPEEYEPPAGAGPQPYHQGGFAGGRGSRPYAGRGGPRRPYGAGRGQYGGDARGAGGGGGGGSGGSRRPMPPVGPEQFGRPGCVVSLENVPYKANVDDILRFFDDFEVTKNNVIRRYNENNMATGDARVCLPTPGEALRAARTLDRQKIGDRVITVRLPR